MREILFRGKLKADNGEHKKDDWVYGDLVRTKDGDTVKTFIYGFGEVDPETVGQFVGLTDKNGKRIYEGDILDDTKGTYGIVKFNPIISCFIGELVDGTSEYLNWAFLNKGDPTRQTQLELTSIIGNIYDNPELIESGESNA